MSEHIEKGSSGHVEECWTVSRGDGGTIPSTAICLCLSEETLKAGGPFYLVSMPRDVKDPTQGVNV